MAGIAVAGTLVADIIKIISHYPEKGTLADISGVSYGIGGCVANTAVGIKKLDPSIEVKSIGLVGNDEKGDFLRKKLQEYGIDCSMLQTTEEESTAFSDVMTVKETGERTFFHNRGTGKLFDESHMGMERLDAELVLLGYGGLLDSLNRPDEVYGTKLAKAFHDMKEKQIVTALDVATLSSAEEMQRLIRPALPYVDYVIVNEIEGGMIAGMEARDAAGKLIPGAMEQISKTIMTMGVQKCCIIHAPEKGCATDCDGLYYEQASLQLPSGYIAGSVGAGDAFCAGILYAVYRGMGMQEALKIGAASAAANLSASDSVGGLRSIEETMELFRRYAAQ